jgi:hypothetical protein
LPDIETLLNSINIDDELKQRIKEDCITMESGHLVYWPDDPVSTHGYLDEYQLLAIAKVLYEVNKPWDEQIRRELG